MRRRAGLIPLILMLLLCIHPGAAMAVGRPIPALEISCAGGTLHYGGTAAPEVKAVAVLLLGPGGDLLKMDSCGVDRDGRFQGSMELRPDRKGAYTVKVSAYEGGLCTEKTFMLYAISYVLDSGTNDGANPLFYSSAEGITLLPATRPGYTFLGWYTGEDYRESVPGWEAGESGDKILHARWKPVMPGAADPTGTESGGKATAPAGGEKALNPAAFGPADSEYVVLAPFATFTGQGDLRAIIDGDHRQFVSLSLDGEAVDPSSYTVTGGSTVVTLKESYLQTLARGTYLFRARFTAGYARLELVVDPGEDPGPAGAEAKAVAAPDKPGKNRRWIWAGAAVLPAIALWIILRACRKRAGR